MYSRALSGSAKCAPRFDHARLVHGDISGKPSWFVEEIVARLPCRTAAPAYQSGASLPMFRRSRARADRRDGRRPRLGDGGRLCRGGLRQQRHLVEPRGVGRRAVR